MDCGDTRTSSSISISHNSSAHHLENKFAKMKEVIFSIEKYIDTRAEDEAIKINQHLLALSLSLDLNIFDPNSYIASKFFISIYNIMNALEPRSLTSWYCVDVLLNACKNASARRALMETYQFLPCLARIVGDQHTMDKNLRLLRLILCITCGIKIRWHVPHMTHLMLILCKWIERKESEISSLALGILVNLCYKNVHSVYILQRNVDLKKFIRMCLALKGPMIEVYVSQISIVLEHISGETPAFMFPSLIENTFTAVVEASRKKDSIVLKQIIEFFMEFVKNNNYNMTSFNNKESIENIMNLIDTKNSNFQDPECLAVILEFINFLIEIKVPQMASLYSEIISLALRWIQESTVSVKALTVLKTIAVNMDKKDEKLLESLVGSLKVFLLILHSFKEDKTILSNTEYIKRLAALLQLLTVLVPVKSKSISNKIATELNEEMFTNILFPVQSDNNIQRLGETTSSTDGINLYIYTLALIAKLAECSNSWLVFQNKILDNPQIHLIMAQAICGSPSEVKKIALELSHSCSDGVASAVANLLSNNTGKEPNGAVFASQTPDMSFSLFPVCQQERLETIMDNFERHLANNTVGNIATSEVMELYTYKFSYLSQAERAALSSLEAATKHCTQLQHGNSQLTYEVRNLQQLEMYNTQKLEELSKKNDAVTTDLKQVQNKLGAEKGKYAAMKLEFDKNMKDLEEKESALNELKEKHVKLQHLFSRVQENCKKHELKEVKHEKIIKDCQERINDYTNQIEEFKKRVEQQQIALEETRTALQAKSAILDSITRMANSSNCC
ncbi:unnamed protein product [Ceutorhynchus assimilis]|uniref:Protein CIP2A n=1 Tax=Ceutorhynchus assimilis TaxID=467358 RepID=A0A9N9MP40_9CUCU|nr:unnamed protein product [Ceutorhynchus assimilis]